MMTAVPTHIKSHSQHIFLADPKYGSVLPGIARSFRLFDVVHLTTQGDRQLLDMLEVLVGEYTPSQVSRVAAAKNRICQAGWRDDLLTMIFFGPFTLIGLVGTEQPKRWKNCGRLAVNGGRLELSNSVNLRALLGMLSQDLKMWTRLLQQGNDVLARAYYTELIEPLAAVLCNAAGV